MDPYAPERIRARLVEKLADSLGAALPELTPRRLVGRATFPGKATAVIGMRRSGKTTFLHQLRQERLNAGTPRERLPYVNLEDEQLAGLEASQLHILLDAYYRQFPDSRQGARVLWCFDEVQTVPGWERFVRRILDTESVDVCISGSSAALLGRELATAMRGRAWEVVLYPFSFEEFLRHQRLAVPRAPAFLPTARRSALEHAFLEYLVKGGFPEAQGLNAPTRRQLLTDYVDVTILRDVVERHGVTQVAGLRWLVRHLLANPAGMFSVEKFYHALRSQGFRIAKDTVHELVGHLEDSFLVRTVGIESDSERGRMVNPRKAYAIDPGLIPLYDPSARPDSGHVLETTILLELTRRRARVTYVRTAEGHEVDFLARYPAGEIELIQVCAEAADARVAARELRALEEAGRRFRSATRRLLTLTRDAMPRDVPRTVAVQPAYEWLLAGGEGADR